MSIEIRSVAAAEAEALCVLHSNIESELAYRMSSALRSKLSALKSRVESYILCEEPETVAVRYAPSYILGLQFHQILRNR